MLVRLVIWGLLGFLLYTLVQMVKQALRKPPAVPPEKSVRGEEMVLDPECGTYLPRNDAVTVEIAGEKRYFCSETCRDKFRQRR